MPIEAVSHASLFQNNYEQKLKSRKQYLAGDIKCSHGHSGTRAAPEFAIMLIKQIPRDSQHKKLIRHLEN